LGIFKNIIRGKHRKNIFNVQPGPASNESASQANFATVWVLGGGKGGTGKSFLAANFGLFLAKLSKKVLFIDADLGAANLHTLLGIDGTPLSLSSFLKAEITELDPLIRNTGIAGLDIITGAMDSLDVPDVKKQSIERLQRALLRTDYDNIIIDIGPGTSSNMLKLLLLADNAIIVTTPEPTSVENTYRYIKCLLLQRIKTVLRSGSNTILRERLLTILKSDLHGQIKSVSDIMLLLKREEASYSGLMDSMMGKTAISLIVNQSRRKEDMKVGMRVHNACLDFFGLDVGYAGAIPYIEGIREHLFQKKSVNLEEIDNLACKAIGLSIDKLLAFGEQNVGAKERDRMSQ